jgi:hypothetical protein
VPECRSCGDPTADTEFCARCGDRLAERRTRAVVSWSILLAVSAAGAGCSVVMATDAVKSWSGLAGPLVLYPFVFLAAWILVACLAIVKIRRRRRRLDNDQGGSRNP